jgi:hypothetical protein
LSETYIVFAVTAEVLLSEMGERMRNVNSDPGKAYTAQQMVDDVGGVTVTARLYVKSSEVMDEVPPESITLTITSQPYWNAIDYDRHADDPGCSTGIR